MAYSDKPDLIDRAQSLGIEVTASQSQDSRKAESLYSKLLYENDSSQEKRRIELIKQCGAHFEKGVLFGPNGTDSFEPIIEALRKKLDRLDSGDYELFRRNELFVRSSILADEEMLREALSNMKKRIPRSLMALRICYRLGPWIQLRFRPRCIDMRIP